MKTLINAFADTLCKKLSDDMVTYHQHIVYGSYSAVRIAHFRREIMYRHRMYKLITKLRS